MDGTTTRRRFLASAAGLAAAAAAGAVVSRPVAAAAGQPTVGPLAGYTLNPRTYRMTDPVAAAGLVDGWLQMPLAATMQKVYYNQLPPRPEGRAGALAAAGCQLLVCVKPPKGLTAAARTALAAALRNWQAAGVAFRLVLFQECDDRRFFASGQAWLRYWQFYAPAVQAEGVRCVYDPGVNLRRFREATGWFPEDPLPDELRMDFYGDRWVRGTRLEPLIAEATAHGVPSGLGEWGPSASFKQITPGQWDGYCGYLRSVAPLLTLGGVYYGSAHRTQNNMIQSAADWKVPGIQAVAAALAGATGA